jgi:hypothetical protein
LCGGSDASESVKSGTGGGGSVQRTGTTATAATPTQQTRETTTSRNIRRLCFRAAPKTFGAKFCAAGAECRIKTETRSYLHNQVQISVRRRRFFDRTILLSGPDNKLYLDFAFFNDLSREFKAPGDFAQAYVIAHEVGHHVQNLSARWASSAARKHQLDSVKLELQADCYAGVWAYYANQQGLVEAGDAEEAIRAASAVGDDSIQKRAQGYVVPESFTHGSSQQRMQWFSRGFQAGDMRQCNTFGR